jgi:hypothetical protein
MRSYSKRSTGSVYTSIEEYSRKQEKEFVLVFETKYGG